MGQSIDISKQEATFGLIRMTLIRALAHGEEINKSRRYFYGGSFPCKDGYVMIYPREDRQWSALAHIMGRPDLADDERFNTSRARLQHGDELNQVISQWAAGLTKKEIYRLVAASGCPAAQFATSEEIFASEQLNARQFFSQVDHPKAGRLSYAGRPYKLTNLSLDGARPAPLLGQHHEEIFCDELGLNRDQLAGLQSSGVV